MPTTRMNLTASLVVADRSMIGTEIWYAASAELALAGHIENGTLTEDQRDAFFDSFDEDQAERQASGVFAAAVGVFA